MNKYMQNESFDVMIGAIAENALSEYKTQLKKNIQQHFENPYCSHTDAGKVIYEKEIMGIIDSIPIDKK